MLTQAENLALSIATSIQDVSQLSAASETSFSFFKFDLFNQQKPYQMYECIFRGYSKSASQTSTNGDILPRSSEMFSTTVT